MKGASIGLSKAAKEIWLRATTPANVRGGAKVPHTTPHFHHSHPYPHAPVAPQPISAASAKHPAGAFIRSIADGVFKSIKTSSYAHPKGPYSSSRLGARPSTILPRRPPPPRARLGVSGARPSFQRPSTTQVGLGAARDFLAGQGVFANVVNNVPLGLRAMGGVGVDERKWKGVRRGLRKEMKKEGKQKENVGASRLFMSKQAEMDLYFTAPFSAEVVASEQAQIQEEPTTRLPVVLIIDIEPELSFTSSLSPSSPASSGLLDPTWRLLTPSVISHFSTITTSYESHAHRIRALHHRLLDAGVFDDPETQTSLEVWRAHDGREVKEVQVTFGAGWDVRDVRNVVGWTGGERVGQWCRVVDLEEERASRMRESEELEASVMTARSCSEHEHELDSQEIHHAISSTFILPDPHSSDTASSLELSPPLSPAPSCDDTLSWNDWDMQSASGVDVGGDYGEEVCPWEDARELAAEDAHTIESSGLSRSYEEDVRTFLGQLDRF